MNKRTLYFGKINYSRNTKTIIKYVCGRNILNELSKAHKTMRQLGKIAIEYSFSVVITVTRDQSVDTNPGTRELTRFTVGYMSPSNNQNGNEMEWNGAGSICSNEVK